MVKDTAVASPTPPGPVGVIVAVLFSRLSGVPVLSPVVAEMLRPRGRPDADQLDTGRSAMSESTGVALNATPRSPLKF